MSLISLNNSNAQSYKQINFKSPDELINKVVQIYNSGICIKTRDGCLNELHINKLFNVNRDYFSYDFSEAWKNVSKSQENIWDGDIITGGQGQFNIINIIIDKKNNINNSKTNYELTIFVQLNGDNKIYPHKAWWNFTFENGWKIDDIIENNRSTKNYIKNELRQLKRN